MASKIEDSIGEKKTKARTQSGLLFEIWRKGRDSNPRCPIGHAAFPGRYIQPLCHPSKMASHSSLAQVFSSLAGRCVPCEECALYRGSRLFPGIRRKKANSGGKCLIGKQSFLTTDGIQTCFCLKNAVFCRFRAVERGKRVCLETAANNCVHRNFKREGFQ